MRRSLPGLLAPAGAAAAGFAAALGFHALGAPDVAASAVAAAVAAIMLATTHARRMRRLRRGLHSLQSQVSAAGSPRASEQPARDPELAPLERMLGERFRAVASQQGALRRDRARLAAIVSGMIEGVLVVNARGEVTLFNDAARRLLRLPRETVGRRYEEIIRHPDVARQMSLALAGDTPGGLELTPHRTPGQVLVARAAPVSAEGEHGAVLVLHDISDLRRTDRIRRDFVANVSHELRTPLTAIRGYVEALLDEPPAPPDARRFLEIVGRHAMRMESLVKDLLRLATLDAGQERLEMAPCDIRHVWDGVVGELASVLDSRRQQVEMAIDPPAARVMGDAAKLHDVFRNLVENASAYSPESTTIRLEAYVEEDETWLRVLDEGPGIPEAHLDRVFERFYRVDKARSRETGGTGLGLSIARHLVELHGGSIRAENRRPRGAIFTVRLPVAGR